MKTWIMNTIIVIALFVSLFIEAEPYQVKSIHLEGGYTIHTMYQAFDDDVYVWNGYQLQGSLDKNNPVFHVWPDICSVR